MKFTKLAAAITLGLAFSAANAATVTTTTPFQVRITINDTCNATTFAAQAISNIDFGNRAVTDTATSAIYANNASGTTLSVTCNNAVTFNVGLTPSNANTGGAGVMANGANTIAYQLYQPTAANAPDTTVNWGNVLGTNTVSRTSTGVAINLPVSAGIATGGLAGKVGGAYTDTVTATLTY